MTQEQLTDFRPDPNNLNKGTERGNYALERSLREYGFARPIVADKEGVILAGNHAFQKAGEIGMKNVRVIETDGTEIIIHKRTDLDADTAKARMIGLVDNRANQLNYQLDEAALASMADNLPDLSNFFNEAEIERLSDASFLDALSDIGGAFDDDEASEEEDSESMEEDETDGDQEFYGFSIPCSYEQRQLIFRAINTAKEALGESASSADSLAHVCNQFLNLK